MTKDQGYINIIKKRYKHLNIIKIKKVKFNQTLAGKVVPDWRGTGGFKTKHNLYIAFINDGSAKILTDRSYDIWKYNQPGQKNYNKEYYDRRTHQYPDYGMTINRRWKNVKTGKFTSKEFEQIFND